MFNEILKKYERFSDGLILELIYRSSLDKKKVEVLIKCMNKEIGYRWETIRMHFIDVVFFRFIENESFSSTVINSALLNKEAGLITFDFFPLIFGDSKLEENNNSDFIVKCKDVNFMVE